MKALSFTKMQGLGNDFVVLDGPLSLTEAEVVELCDRRFGVGGDGVLVVTNGDPIRMEYWNADGSRAEMCGNGLRCVARYSYDRGWAPDRNFGVQTPVGVRGARVLEDVVEVEIGRPTVTGHTTIADRRYHLIDVGNPHAVLKVADPSGFDVATVGPAVERDPQFSNGTNVEFMTVSGGAVEMRVWERGVGETLACGTGIVAAAFVATKTDRLKGAIRVHTPGGDAEVELRDGVAWLRGPASYSFRGNIGER